MLPGPLRVAAAFVRNFPLLMGRLGRTLFEALPGLVLSVAAALLPATLMEANRFLKTAVSPVLLLTQTIPVIALAPLLVLWMGYGAAPKITLVFLTCFFPLTVGLLGGFAQADTDAVRLLLGSCRGREPGTGQIRAVLDWTPIISHNTSGIMSLASGGIGRPRDLAGKRFASWETPLVSAVIRTIVEGDGGDFSQVKMIPNAATDAFSALETDVDAIWIYYAWDGIAAELRGLEHLVGQYQADAPRRGRHHRHIRQGQLYAPKGPPPEVPHRAGQRDPLKKRFWKPFYNWNSFFPQPVSSNRILRLGLNEKLLNVESFRGISPGPS
jgi:hypothetical protein